MSELDGSAQFSADTALLLRAEALVSGAEGRKPLSAARTPSQVLFFQGAPQ